MSACSLSSLLLYRGCYFNADFSLIPSPHVMWSCLIFSPFFSLGKRFSKEFQYNKTFPGTDFFILVWFLLSSRPILIAYTVLGSMNCSCLRGKHMKDLCFEERGEKKNGLWRNWVPDSFWLAFQSPWKSRKFLRRVSFPLCLKNKQVHILP